jgi:L-alanine-DL-glutamate epimerase-like enolase superfamily enzyme
VKVVRLETFPLSIPYRRNEVSALISRAGVSDVLVKITTDDGLVGWGEACMNSETVGIERAVQAAVPFVLGRDPWDARPWTISSICNGARRTMSQGNAPMRSHAATACST